MSPLTARALANNCGGRRRRRECGLRVTAVGSARPPFDLRTARARSVFDSGGTWPGDVAFPTGLDVHRIGADLVPGRWTDELDVE